MRKVSGASRGQIAWQFVNESVVMAALALVAALLLVPLVCCVVLLMCVGRRWALGLASGLPHARAQSNREMRGGAATPTPAMALSPREDS